MCGTMETTFIIISLIPPDVKKCASSGAKIKNITVKKIPPLRGLCGLVMGINFSTVDSKKGGVK